jgi:hypothetical protein
VVLVVLLAIPLTVLLSRAFGGFARDVVVVPILYLLWVVRLYISAVPQILFWGALVLFGIAVAVTSILVDVGGAGGRGGRFQEGAALRQGYSGEVRRLVSQIRFAERSTYFRRHLAQRLGKLMVRYLDYGEQYRPAQIERALDALDAPPEIRAFLREGKQVISRSRPAGLIAWLRRRLWGAREAGVPDLDIEQVVRFLEDRLEVL